MIVKDASKWEDMAGDSVLEKKINSYLTCRFISSLKVPCDECLSEAREIVKIIKQEYKTMIVETIENCR